jgi:hypothetical protein
LRHLSGGLADAEQRPRLMYGSGTVLVGLAPSVSG